MKLKKATNATRTALDVLLARQTARVQRAFRRFLENVRDDRTLTQITRMLQRGDIEAALSVVDRYIVEFGRVIPEVFSSAGAASMAALRPSIGITFDPGNPRAAELMQQSRLNFIQQFSEGQREATRAALSEALATGKGPRESARAFRDSIGLTTAQQNMVNNYQRSLETGSSNALNRQLRDRRFDSTVGRVIDGETLLSSDQIETMVGRYSQNMLGLRAETIARTESLRLVSEAREEALHQVLDETGIDPSLVERTWVATDDHRTRDSHADLDGQTVGLDEPFITFDGVELMYPGDPNGPPEEVISCRCTVAINIGRGTEEVEEG